MYKCLLCNTKFDKPFSIRDQNTNDWTAICPICTSTIFTEIIDEANVNRCVCCGAIIPEGRMVCLQCEYDMEVT